MRQYQTAGLGERLCRIMAPIPGSISVFWFIQEDPEPEAILMIGEMVEPQKKKLLKFIKKHVKKPLVLYRWRKLLPLGALAMLTIISGGKDASGRKI